MNKSFHNIEYKIQPRKNYRVGYSRTGIVYHIILIGKGKYRRYRAEQKTGFLFNSIGFWGRTLADISKALESR